MVPFYNFAPVDSPFVLEKSLLTFERFSDDLLGDLLDMNMRTHEDPRIRVSGNYQRPDKIKTMNRLSDNQ